MFEKIALCLDIDECTEGLDDCSDDAVCVNTEGSFSCTCERGFTGDGRVCLVTQLNQNECEDGSNDCSQNAECIDLEDGYMCRCRVGFRGDGNTCTGRPLVK